MEKKRERASKRERVRETEDTCKAGRDIETTKTRRKKVDSKIPMTLLLRMDYFCQKWL